MNISTRGVIEIQNHIVEIENRDYSFLQKLDLGFHVIFDDSNFKFAAVDIFASLPLYYTVIDGVPYISEDIDFLVSKNKDVLLDTVGFYCSSTIGKNIRSVATPFKQIKRIPPGSFLEFYKGDISLRRYWNFSSLNGQRYKGTFEEASRKIGKLIQKSVKQCQEHDSLSAVHLSGGLDSGVIASIVASQNSHSTKAYYIKFGSSLKVEPNSENFYVQKYKEHYPNLNVLTIDTQKLNFEESQYIESAGNWFGLLGNNRQLDILKDAQKNKVKTILTGLGGDEFSSVFYHKGMQNFKPLNTVAELQRYHTWQLGYKPRLKAFKDDFMRSKSLSESKLFFQLRQSVFDSSFIFSKSFKRDIKNLLTRPMVPLSRTPMSQNLRIKQIVDNYITIRSDKWNLQGMKFDVDYIHPLLHKELVSFCLTLPFEIYMQYGSREMMKMAIGDLIDPELAGGIKRPSKRDITDQDWMHLKEASRSTLEKILLLKESKASNYFDFDGILSLLQLVVHNKLGRTVQAFYLSGILHGTILKVIFGGYFINTHFRN